MTTHNQSNSGRASDITAIENNEKKFPQDFPGRLF